MIDPVSGGLAAAGLVMQLFQGQQAKKAAAQARADALGMHHDNLRFGKSSRTDAYGNTVRYDDDLAQWFTDLTPMQKKLLSAGEHEQFLGLTEDAGRNRSARRRQADIGESSAQDYNTQLAGFRYGPQKSEQSIFDEISNLVARARSAPNAQRTRQQLRQGRPIVQASDSGSAHDDAATALATRRAALDEFTTRNNSRNSQYLPALGFFREGAGGGGGAPISFDNQSDELGKTQDSMAQLIGQLSQSGASNMLKAGQDVTESIGTQFGKAPLTDSARMIAALRGQPLRGAGTKAVGTKGGLDDSYNYKRSLDDLIY